MQVLKVLVKVLVVSSVIDSQTLKNGKQYYKL